MRLPQQICRLQVEELPLDRDQVLRYLRYKPGVTRLEARHQALVDEGIDQATAVSEPAASVRYCSIRVSADTVATQIPGLTWRSASLAKLLQDAVGISLVAATLGPGVEERTAALFQEEEFALATVVDAAGTALVQALVQKVRAHLSELSPKMELTGLYGPGYGDWDIREQIPLTAAAGAFDIGLRVTDTCYLQPQKSLVGIIGWLAPGAQVSTGCALCSLRGCPYRVKTSRIGEDV